MLVGRKRQSETDAVYKCAMFLKLYAAARPQDAELRSCADDAKIRALAMLYQDKNQLDRPGKSQDDCEWCEGDPPCRPCRFDTPQARRDAIQRHLGGRALEYLRRYREERNFQ